MGHKKKGILSTLISGALAIVIIGGIVAFFRINKIDSFARFYEVARIGSDKTKKCYENLGKGCINVPDVSGSGGEGNSSEKGSTGEKTKDGILTDKELRYKGPAGGESFIQDSAKVSKEFIQAALAAINIGEYNKAKLTLSDWGYFSQLNGDDSCWTSKKEVLYAQAVPESIKMKDADHNETKDKSKACTISEGVWVDPYSGEKIKDPAEMTVDHIVSIKEANKMGGSEWSPEKKKEFANDTDTVLLAVSKKSKEKRGDKSPVDFTPDNKHYRCEFVKNYTVILDKYKLTLESKDKDKLSEIISSCKK